MTFCILYSIITNAIKKRKVVIKMKVMILDTETTNNMDDPIVYDIGFVITDENGEIYEKRSYVIADTFLDKELMENAYFKDKIPMYWEDIKNGKRELKRFSNVNFIIRNIMKKYNIKVVCAHNARFDYISTNTTKRYITSSKFRYFFPYGTEIWDTLKMSKEIFSDDISYRNFCLDNGYITKNRQNRYTAEIIYRFISNDNSFEESHTGLEDVLIEKDIFVYCLQKKPDIDGALWLK